MFNRIVTTCLTTLALTAQIAAASPFVEGNTAQKNEPRPAVGTGAPKLKLPSTPLPPLPSSHPGGGMEQPKKRWDLVGRIDNRIIVTDTQSGEMLSLSEGDSLAGGCVATSAGVLCGKDATTSKHAARSENRKIPEANRLDELIFSAHNIAQKCIQLDDTLKSEIVRTNGALKQKDTELEQTRKELEDKRADQEQLLANQKNLQEQLISAQSILEKTKAENAKMKDDTAFLLTTIAILERDKGKKYTLPGAEGMVFKGNDVTTIVLNIKDTPPLPAAPPSGVVKPAEEGKSPTDLNSRRDK